MVADGIVDSDGLSRSLPVSGTNTAALGVNFTGTIIGNWTLNIIQRSFAVGMNSSAAVVGWILLPGLPFH